MKNTIKRSLQVSGLTVLLLGLVACGNGNNATNSSANSTNTEELKPIKVGASSTPHAEILDQVKDDLTDEGYDLQVQIFDDYIQPNVALDTGDLDANYFQHITYLNNFNEERGTDLQAVADIHFEALGIYPGKVKSLEELKNGAQIAVPNDATNEARALLLLESAGLIKLKDNTDISTTLKDITENPKNLDIVELEASQIPRSLEDVDIAVVNGNYAVEAGFNAKEDALAFEEQDSPSAKSYVNVIAVKNGNEDNEGVQALIKALQTDKVKKYIEENYQGAVLPMF
ncbi:MAG TPA: MetQ/NlpA family ABC transporter substrate-binding protein [Candidatus Tetragenococcus pullicola]|nr:MetQ/NlpA family ABC transporter substrate-binding protein [Candidatus Tetragenococcus pullicola]